MLYTVKEVSDLSNVTIKTLHHYHKIGLVVPCEISEAGYRLYGRKELERLQEVLFYKELDLPLEKIAKLLESNPERLTILSNQKEQLVAWKSRLTQLISTLESSIMCTRNGGTMDHSDMFKGFQSEEEWNSALAEQNEHLKEKYQFDLLENNPVNVAELNEQAQEAARFMHSMVTCLREGRRHDDERVSLFIQEHLAFLNIHGHVISPANYAAQSRFFLSDDFHRQMLESQQLGLAYYLCLAAEAHAAV